MSEKVVPGPLSCANGFKEAVCINTTKVYDTCKDKDCLEDLRVYFDSRSQEIIDKAINVKVRKAEIIWVYIDVEEVPFNRGFYAIDVKYFFKVTLDAFCGVSRPMEVRGLSTFDKKVILFGSEGSAKTFTSSYRPDGLDPNPIRSSNQPKAIVEVVDPIALGVKLVEKCEKHCGCGVDLCSVPDAILREFDGDLVDNDPEKMVYVTLGIFSIIKIVRDVQLLIPAYDFCIPEKECIGNEDDPCRLFRSIKFPTEEFFPPASMEIEDEDRHRHCEPEDDRHRGCGCR
ncbi:MAG: hypothetical protein Q8865_02435 [Bacillota bacterium]|nr:hypothetical protein [Bacillota bacterium]